LTVTAMNTLSYVARQFDGIAAAKTPLKGRDFLLLRYWSAAMPKAARISPSVSKTSSSTNSDSAQFISVALFSGVGLLISLVAVLAGVKGYWF